MAARVSQAQLERALGGMDKLLQLADRNGTGNLADATVVAFIQDVLDEGNGEVNGYIEAAVDLGDVRLQTAPTLIRYELAVDVYLAWFKGTGGAAVPPEVKAEYDRISEKLEKIRIRKGGIGISPRAGASQQVQQVTKSDTEPYFNPKSPRSRFGGWS